MSLASSGFAVQWQLQVEQSNRVWAGDLTYVWTTEGGLSLALVLDLYSRTVGSWLPVCGTSRPAAAHEHGISTCMSCTGNYWDHACIQRLLRTLKRERMCRRHDAMRDEATQGIASTARWSPIGGVGTRPSVRTSRSSLRRGGLRCYPESMDVGEGQMMLARSEKRLAFAMRFANKCS